MSTLDVEHLVAAYGRSQVLFDVSLSLSLGVGETVALMGRNGAGKTTTVKTICGLLPIGGGDIRIDGQSLKAMKSFRIARLGIGLVPEGRRCFPNLTVRENLAIAACDGEWTLKTVEALFPRLAERRDQAAASLSGGEQQMVAIGRALMINPRLLILDEATEGLAPIVRQEIWQALGQLKRASGLALLIIDKSSRELAAIADRAVVLSRGATVWSGDFGDLSSKLSERYLGVAGGVASGVTGSD